jgi:riboflavin kinase/FMN adenylyltransferase
MVPDEARRGVLSIGNFDGVHRGHAMLLKRLMRMSRQCDGPAVGFTFDPHPATVLRPGSQPPPLTWRHRKIELLESLGLDWLVVCPAQPHVLELSAEAFYQQVICGRLAARGLVEGPNFLFGKGRGGDVEQLQHWCLRDGLKFEIEPTMESGGEVISSTRIRALVAAGDVDRANELLVAPYRICGQVVRGAGRGAGLGFATANLAEIPVLIPGPGVYATRMYVGDRPLAAAAHIGPNPTFDELQPKVEVHALDFRGDLYGQVVSVDFLARVREIARFPTPAALQLQLQQDIQRVRMLVAQASDPAGG